MLIKGDIRVDINVCKYNEFILKKAISKGKAK